MILTSAQLAAIKADILANSDLNVFPNNSDGNVEVAKLYNLFASPDFYVFRSNIPPAEIFDQVTWANYTPAGVADLTNAALVTARSQLCQGKQFNLQIMLQGQSTFNAGRATLRAGLNDATTALPSNEDGSTRSGGWTNILPILRRLGTRIEKLFAVQTSGVGVAGGDPLGATTNPALLVVEGNISYQQVTQARELP